MPCHDFKAKASRKLLLSADSGLVFNQSYLQLHNKKVINAIGAGGDKVQEGNTWGAKHSLLIKKLESGHNKNISKKELDILRGWIDLNASYYPNEDSVYGDNTGDRFPLTTKEVYELRVSG